MKAKTECLLCHGEGVIVDPDPCKPVKICGCSKDGQGGAPVHGIPERYREVSMESFWKWWKRLFPDEQIHKTLQEAKGLLESDVCRETISLDLQNKLAGVISKCAAKHDSEKGRDVVKHAQEPNGFGALKTWILKDHSEFFCWIDGPPCSGRSSLASAALQSWCEKTKRGGLFVSVRTFSQELKDTYYDIRSWQNTDFRSERDRMAPLQAAPCLVLDDFDRMDSGDVRVARAFAQLLDYRYSEKMPTIITALKWTESLRAERENYPIMKLEDSSLLNRLSQARRVELVPTLTRLMRSIAL
jgi:hypothetical protein